MDYTYSVAVITGAESGIGEQTAKKLLENSCHVIGLDFSRTTNGNHKNPNYQLIQIDITDLEKMQKTIDAVHRDWGRIDILVNCAGVTSLQKVDDIKPADWDRIMDINLKAVFFCCQTVLKYMKVVKRGKIINISSNAGKEGGKAVGAHYSASKAGVISLTRSLALDAAEYNININCVAPGPTKTSMTQDWDEGTNKKLKEKIPLGRFAAPEEIAEAIAFLASDSADFITGETLNVNGGLLMD